MLHQTVQILPRCNAQHASNYSLNQPTFVVRNASLAFGSSTSLLTKNLKCNKTMAFIKARSDLSHIVSKDIVKYLTQCRSQTMQRLDNPMPISNNSQIRHHQLSKMKKISKSCERHVELRERLSIWAILCVSLVLQQRRSMKPFIITLSARVGTLLL